MPNCLNCSAPLPANAITCSYCGSRNDVDLTAVHYYTTHETDSERICPLCSIPLKTIDLQLAGNFLIERCPQCLGLFFDPNELEALLDYGVKNVFQIDRDRLNLFQLANSAERRSATYVKCPVCAKLMNRTNYGAKSGVVIDRCKEHGVWLDAGELRQLCEWVKAGGQLLDRQRQEEIKKEALILKAKEQQRQAGSGTVGNNYDSYGLGLGSEPDILDTLFKAVRFFTRL